MSCEEKETCTDEQDVETQGERHLQETWETAKHQAPRERRGTDSYSQPSRNQACYHLDWGSIASRTERQCISVVSATQCVVLCYRGLGNECRGHPWSIYALQNLSYSLVTRLYVMQLSLCPNPKNRSLEENVYKCAIQWIIPK